MACPIELWQRSVARTPRHRIPPTPSAKLRNLNDAARVRELYWARDWEMCNSCGRSGTYFVLKKCAGCGVLPGPRTLYCSRTCQRREWPVHQQFCGQEAAVSMRKELASGVDMQVWQNFGRGAAKRMEGLRDIMKWAFEEVWLANPTIDRQTRCFSVYCRSSQERKGRIYVDAFQLQKMDETPYGRPKDLMHMMRPGVDLGVVCLFVDGISHAPKIVQLQSHQEPQPELRQWPWIVATVTPMKNHNAELGMMRLGTIVQRVQTLVSADKDEMHKFEVPRDFVNGKRWEMRSFDRWQKIFGKVVRF